MSAPFIAAEGLSRWYGQVLGLNDATITLEGGVIGLLGPNGAGKSTFLRLVTGQLKPSQGQVRVLGERPFANPRLMARLGVVPDQDAFYEDMTGVDFVTTLLRLNGHGRRAARARAAAALDRVDLGAAASKPMRAMSKGMRQRVKIAQAIAHEPEALLLDEPLQGADPVGRRHITELIRALGAEGRHVLVSSHILHEVEALTRRIVLIDRGRLVAEGTIEEIRALMDRHPHRVQIACDRPRRLAAALLPHPDVVSLRLEGADRLTAETDAPEAFYGRLAAACLESGVEVERVESPDDGLQALFDYLVR